MKLLHDKFRNILLASLLILMPPIAGAAEDKSMKILSTDQAAIERIVQGVGVLADRGEFDALSRMFASSFILDYSSLNGLEASTKTPNQLMDEWAGVLPGFDQTRHEVNGIEIVINGMNAMAKAKVIASHWINDLFWQVEGNYEYKLQKVSNDWKIISMTFNLSDESGTREVFGPAIKAASKKILVGHSLSIAERNKQRVRDFFAILENGNIPTLVEMFSSEGEQINPYTGGVFPNGAKGREALSKYWSPVPDNFEQMRFPITQLLATEDPNLVFVAYKGKLALKDVDEVYENSYYSTFRFDSEGKISEYVEIFDPVVAAKSFGLMDQLN